MKLTIDVKHDTSMLEIAYNLLKNYSEANEKEKEHIVLDLHSRRTKQKIESRHEVPEGIYFYDLFDEVAKIKGFTEEEKNDKISDFYTNLTLSGDFLMVAENYWDLSSNHYSYERTGVNLNIYDEDYDEESIRAAKERYIAIKQAKGEEITKVDMKYVMEHIDELLSEEDIDEDMLS